MRRLFWAITLVMLMGCTQGTLLHHYEAVSSEGWIRTDTLLFDIPKVECTADYDLNVGMRYYNKFPYEGVWIVVDGTLQEPSAHWCDTLYFRIADADGKPLGHGISLLQRDSLVRQIHLYEGQHGQLRLWHIMKREVMPGVREVGCRLF